MDDEDRKSQDENADYTFESAPEFVDEDSDDQVSEGLTNVQSIRERQTESSDPLAEDSRIKDNLIPFERFTTVTSLPFESDTLLSYACNKVPGALENATFLRTRGLHPVPANPTSKNLRKVASTDVQYDDINFRPGDNIAIRIGPVKNELLGLDSEFAIVDLDLEVEEARIFAYHYLKHINTVSFGRRSAVRSHYLFRVRTKEISSKKNQFEWPAGMRSRNKNDADSALILELKPSGHCLVPPSTHPSGEKLFWMKENLDFITLPYRDIYMMAGRIASGAILLRSWASGLRDNIVISTSGWLLKEGWSYKEVAEFMNSLFSCAWPVDQTDVRRWRIRIQTLAKEIEKAKQEGKLSDMDEANEGNPISDIRQGRQFEDEPHNYSKSDNYSKGEGQSKAETTL